MKELDPSTMIELLEELGRRLDSQGYEGHLYVVGGEAMALAYGRTTLTRDIDAVFEPKSVIYDIARDMATEREWLSADWLNDGVKGFLRGPDPDPSAARVIHASAGISVQVASPMRLLAMKVASARVGRDTEDILLLADQVGATSITEVLDIALAEYGTTLPARSKFLVIELLQGHLPLEAP